MVHKAPENLQSFPHRKFQGLVVEKRFFFSPSEQLIVTMLKVGQPSRMLLYLLKCDINKHGAVNTLAQG